MTHIQNTMEMMLLHISLNPIASSVITIVNVLLRVIRLVSIFVALVFITPVVMLILYDIVLYAIRVFDIAQSLNFLIEGVLGLQLTNKTSPSFREDNIDKEQRVEEIKVTNLDKVQTVKQRSHIGNFHCANSEQTMVLTETLNVQSTKQMIYDTVY